MKKKSYLRFLGKHLIPWLLAAAGAAFAATYAVQSPYIAEHYTNDSPTNTIIEMLNDFYTDGSIDRTPKEILTIDELSHCLDSGYILYDNETNSIVCDNSAVTHLIIVQQGEEGNSKITLYSEDEELLQILHPFQKLYYDFTVTAEDVYISKEDPTQFVLGKFTVDAYPPKLAGKEYHASYDTTPQDTEHYTRYICDTGNTGILPADTEKCKHLAVYVGGALPDSDALQEVHRYCHHNAGDYSENPAGMYAPKRPFSAELAELCSIPIGDTSGARYSLYSVQFCYWYADILLKLIAGYAVLLLIAVLLAMLTAHISYAKYCKQYENDEYRRNLTSLLAHDLKSPLAVISGYAENLRDNVGTEKREHYADAIVQKTQYMDGIIADTLNLAKTEDMTVQKKTTVDLMTMTEDIFSKMQERIEEKELTTRFEGNCTIKANAALMNQALTNLAVNAVKFTPPHGTITVTGLGQGIRFTNDADDTFGNVSDLAEPFAKGDASRSADSGSGLGLSIVRNIAAMQTLRLELRSEGNRFSAELKR
ncbi:MAG: HAMP domain-containing histidine kinase [Oscillospiraceae bacterium]|nr:HAMP domain-containing histidine kinase [Oscillospiraceae bacterium]